MSYFTIKENVDRQIFRAFNLVSDFIFLLNFKKVGLIKKNSNYENINSGERCFVIGTGPSLSLITNQQAQKLADEKVFAVNSFYKTALSDSVTPTYYTLIDNNYWGVSQKTFSEIHNKYQGQAPTFITDIRASPIVSKLNGARSIYIYSKNYPVKSMRLNISANSSITMNTVSTSIISAMYMGFKEIYLLGCDYNLFCTRSGSHCYDDTEEVAELPKYNLAFYLKYYHLTTEFHYLIHKLAKKNGVKIINLTPGSLLDAYPLCDIDSVLS